LRDEVGQDAMFIAACVFRFFGAGGKVLYVGKSGANHQHFFPQNNRQLIIEGVTELFMQFGVGSTIMEI